MPSTISAYGNHICGSERQRYEQEVGAARAAIADHAEPGAVDVTGLLMIEPTGECEWEPGHATSTDELVWLTSSSRLLGGFDAHHMYSCRGCLPAAVADMLNGGTAGTPQVHVGVLQQLMTVHVPDPGQRRGFRQVTVSVRCPDCGQLRGRPRHRRDYTPRHGVFDVQTWHNPCGHPDELAALVAEHEAIAGVQHAALGVAA